MSAPWTPGPWHVDKYGQVCDSSDIVAAEIMGEGPKVYKANANLIAAAPEMYEALADMVCDDCSHSLRRHLDYTGCQFEPGDSDGIATAPCQCKAPSHARQMAALAKARGETMRKCVYCNQYCQRGFAHEHCRREASLRHEPTPGLDWDRMIEVACLCQVCPEHFLRQREGDYCDKCISENHVRL